MKTTALLLLLTVTLLLSGCAAPVAVGPASGIAHQSTHHGNSDASRTDLTTYR